MTKAAKSSSAAVEARLLKQTYIMGGAFLLAWTPYALICMITASQPDNPFSPKVALVPSLFAKTSTIYNVLIYLGMNKQVRLRNNNTIL